MLNHGDGFVLLCFLGDVLAVRAGASVAMTVCASAWTLFGDTLGPPSAVTAA